MPIKIDERNLQHLMRGHAVMCRCKIYAYSNDSGVLAELSKVANDARDYCLDAPDMLPAGGMSEHGNGPFGWHQKLLPRAT